MKKKDFKTNPAMSFISTESIEKVDGKPQRAITSIGAAKAPAGYKVNPEYIETKSRRVQILLQPSVYEAVKEKAKAEGISVNEAINTALKIYAQGEEV